MKKWIHNLAEYKFITAIYFTAAILLGSIISYFHGIRSFSFVTIWEMLAGSVVFGGLHYITTSRWPIKIRIPVHCALSYLAVILFSHIFGWGFTETVSVFWQFTAVFAGVYILIFLAFSLYYHNEAVYLNAKLVEFKENNQ